MRKVGMGAEPKKTMEQQIEALKAENTRLKEENKHLKEENAQLKPKK